MASITDPIRRWPKLQGTGHWVAVDTETTGLNTDDPCQRKNCGPKCPGRVHITTVSMAGDGWSVVIPFDVIEADNAGEDVWNELTEWLSKQNLIMHHAKFDTLMFLQGAPFNWKGVDLRKAIGWDTKLTCWIMFPLEKSGLKPTATRLWGYDEASEQREMQEWLTANGHEIWEIWYAPAHVHLPYALQDSVLTYRLQQFQTHKVTDENLDEILDLCKRELEVCKVLIGMEHRGIIFDAATAENIAHNLEDQKKYVAAQLPFRPTDMQALKYWKSICGNDPIWRQMRRTPTGRISLDAEGLQMIVDAKVPHAAEYMEYGDVDLAISRYYGTRDKMVKGKREASWRMMNGKDGRLRADFQQDGTTSTRFSCRRVNLQAIPKEETAEDRYPSPRVCMAAKPGFNLVEMDLSQAEVRVAAAVAQCKALRSVVESGENIHKGTAKLVFPELDWNRPDWKTAYAKEYHAAKTLNFMIQYGAGPAKIATALKCTEVEAVGYRDRYHIAFPEIKRTMAIAQHKAETRGYVYLISGRKRYFADDEKLFKALNAIVQGNVAEAMKDVMVWINEFYPEYLLIQIHDSVVMEVPDTREGEKSVEYIKKTTESMLTELFGISMVADLKVWSQQEAVPA